MEVDSAIVDPIHIFNDQEYEIKYSISETQINSVQKPSDDQSMFHYRKENENPYYFLIKKGEEYNSSIKYSFIRHLEKAYELIHPSILKLIGYSIERPYLYYKHFENHILFKDSNLSDIDIQKYFLGIASGLIYLLSKGYYYSNFSINSILINPRGSIKLIDYVNFDDLDEKEAKKIENNLIIKYSEILKNAINKRIEQNPQLIINGALKTLLERCENEKKLPTLQNFVDFFNSSSYLSNNIDIINDQSFQKYLEYINLTDIIVCDNFLTMNFDTNRLIDDSIEDICFYIYNNSDEDKLNNYFRYLFVSLPNYYIIPLIKFFKPLSDKLIKYLYYEDPSLVFPDWNHFYSSYSENNPYKLYEEIMKQMNIFEKIKNETFAFNKKYNEIEIKIEALRIQAVYYLKKASKMFNAAKIKIEMAIQYIKGYIFPCNLMKAKNILESITNCDVNIINQIKENLDSKIKSSLIDNILPNLDQSQREIILKAEKGDILSILYVGFAFYFGYDGFPISHSLSVYYYRIASKKSPYAMTLLGYFYLNGIIFPRNFIRARKCFKRASENGSIKAQIMDCLFRKHLWRTYLLKFEINDLFNHYLESFYSIFPNDSLVFDDINNNIDNNDCDRYLFTLKLCRVYDDLYSSQDFENYSMCLTSNSTSKWRKDLKPIFSAKILLSSKNLEDVNDVNEQMFIAKSYFNGENNFPVNYEKAALFFKLAADNGNSEAQWRFALLCYNGIGTPRNSKLAKEYFEKSYEQNDEKGKFYYSLYLKEYEKDQFQFEQLLKECCELGNIDAIYQYAMSLEITNTNLERSIEYYKIAANKGHLDSLIRLIYSLNFTSKNQLYEEYLSLSVGILNEPLLVRLIEFYDNKSEYHKSNTLIQVGIKLNYQLFNAYYSEHLMFGKGIDVNIERARKLILLAFNDEYPLMYRQKYIYLMLLLLVMDNEHQKAADFLIKNRYNLSERYRKDYLLFYKKFDKKIANFNFITVNYNCELYPHCQLCLMEFRRIKNSNSLMSINELKKLAHADKNCYAMSILGKIYKQGKYTQRDLLLAIEYFHLSAERGCPEGYYYLGKEYLYGRSLERDYEQAKKYFLLALMNDGEPRAGYYLYKIPGIRLEENVDDINCLKISASYGYRRALYKYGKLLYTGKDDRIKIDKSKGCNLIQQASYLNYKKAIKFCKIHNIVYQENQNMFDFDRMEEAEFVSPTNDIIETEKNNKPKNLNESDDISISSTS